MLRNFRMEDAKSLVRLLNDSDVSKWTSNIPYPYTENDAISWLENLHSTVRKPHAIEINNKLVGCVSFWEYDSESIEIGYWIGKEFWGKGIATKALQNLFIQPSFPKNKNIVAKVATQNIASQRVLEKCRFEISKKSLVYRQELALSAFVYRRVFA
ncbi:GNAT family N-acetyltransferase [Alteromonas lipotrueiana]|uniref:GNAT family N-acetyltransferase n=1 Tax=Alteromonas lipotrueiana TaxID=2803815 RepID=UPI001C49059E|nr:GNAT family N-acetyltransferase [Alteromonas lipotrueiana]